VANLSITSLCNRSCSYCFARPERLSLASGAPHMSRTTFASALNFLQRSGVTHVQLLGGEPTLHPEFIALLGEIRRRGLSALVFSNGLIATSVLRALDRSAMDGVRFLINASVSDDSAGDIPAQRAVLKRLGAKAMLGVNIASPSNGFSALFDRIEEFRLAPLVRLGLAHPCEEGGNRWLRPNQYAAAGKRLRDLRRVACRREIGLSYDCGFVPCLFGGSGPEELEEILREAQFVCGPIPDILPDGSLIPCYPLGRKFREGRIPSAGTADDVRARFSARSRAVRSAGIFRECEGCPFRVAGRCPGGCLAAAMRRLRGGDAAGTLLNTE
jgi:radical SAM protein with 4Fe4S-binding SPASM domain